MYNKYNFLYVWRVINHITNKISVNPQASPISPTYPYGSNLGVNGSIVMKLRRNNNSSDKPKWLKEHMCLTGVEKSTFILIHLWRYITIEDPWYLLLYPCQFEFYFMDFLLLKIKYDFFLHAENEKKSLKNTWWLLIK